jgi:hypothetical protein
LEKVITELKPTPTSVDPATNFWTVYKKVADEHDSDLLSKYAEDLDNSLVFVSIFGLCWSTLYLANFSDLFRVRRVYSLPSPLLL